MVDRRKGIKAWLVQWEWATEAARVNKPLIAALPSRTGHRRVARFVELVYAGASYDPAELLDYTVNPRANPYNEQYPQRLPAPDGRGEVSWYVAVVCGHNPYVTASLVQNLRSVEMSTAVAYWLGMRLNHLNGRSASAQRESELHEAHLPAVSLPW